MNLRWMLSKRFEKSTWVRIKLTIWSLQWKIVCMMFEMSRRKWRDDNSDFVNRKEKVFVEVKILRVSTFFRLACYCTILPQFTSTFSHTSSLIRKKDILRCKRKREVIFVVICDVVIHMPIYPKASKLSSRWTYLLTYSTKYILLTTVHTFLPNPR